MHDGVTYYLGGALSLASLEGSNPKAILELGSGSGAWAIQAAKQFPNAEVLAVDLMPMPTRSTPLPNNLKFRILDVTQELPFPPESFDIIHARFLFVHLPNHKELFSRLTQIIKPGGWFLIEDTPLNFRAEGGLPPNHKAFCEALHALMKKRGINPLGPIGYEELLKGLDVFEQVNTHNVVAPMLGSYGDDKLNKLGSAMKDTWERSMLTVTEQIGAVIGHPKSLEIREGLQRELKDPWCSISCTLYFSWSRKRL
ncbi:S-adenosyl-L-methionine-dependent methyltransferase [Ramaria rubella]|nr:S-adenosyl-L-methionine-dependent methyltransferase [Ramaria rubella]